MILSNILKFREKIQKRRDGGEVEEKPMLSHLEDLRKCILKVIVSILFFLVGGLVFRLEIFEFLKLPLKLSGISLDNFSMLSLKPIDPIVISLKLAFYFSLILSSPFNLFFIVSFALPALSKKERKVLFQTMFIGSFLFLGGAFFCYYLVLPRTLSFFYNESLNVGFSPSWTAHNYYSFTALTTIIFGCGFELPVVVMALVKMDILEFSYMKRTRSFAIIIILVVSAVVTPTTDMLTLMLLSVPLIILYEICIWLSYFSRDKSSDKVSVTNRADDKIEVYEDK